VGTTVEEELPQLKKRIKDVIGRMIGIE